jgi:hypothetical protein
MTGPSKRLLAIVFAALPLTAAAQVSVTLHIDHASYLVYEKVEARIVVKNETNGVLSFKSNEVSVVVQELTGREVSSLTDRPICKGLVILSGESEEVTVELGRRFAIQTPGKYLVRGAVTRGTMQYQSAARGIDIVPGLEIAKVRAAVPDNPDSVRTYTLRSWDRENDQHLFLRVVDERAGVCYGVYGLGTFIRVVDPEVVVDFSGRVSVRRQIERSAFAISHFLSNHAGVSAVSNEVRRLEAPPHMRKARGGS